jgi:dCMP deaminase
MSLPANDGDYVGYSTWRTDTVVKVREHLAAAGQTGNCRKRKVGAAILDQDGTILVAAANGTPAGVRRCDAGGCVRCAASGRYPHGVGYDLCLCVHAEQAVLISALRQGIDVAGRILATSYQPCFMCAKLIVAAGLGGVLYSEPWSVPEEESQLPGLRDDYAALWDRLPDGCQPFTAAASGEADLRVTS